MKCIVCISVEVTDKEVCDDCFDGKRFFCPDENCNDSKPSLRKLRLHHNAAHNEKLPNSRCKSCKNVFNGHTRYCENCSKPNKSEKAICVECGDSFEYYPSSSSGKYCSNCPSTAESDLEIENDTTNSIETDEREFDSPGRRVENPKVKGEITEQILKAKFMKEGHSILEPVGDSNSFDFVIYTGEEFIRVQCKSGRYKNGCVRFSTESNGWSQEKRDYNGQIEYFAVWCDELDQAYFVPIEECGKSSKSLRVDNPNVSNPNISWASNFEL